MTSIETTGMKKVMEKEKFTALEEQVRERGKIEGLTCLFLIIALFLFQTLVTTGMSAKAVIQKECVQVCICACVVLVTRRVESKCCQPCEWFRHNETNHPRMIIIS